MERTIRRLLASIDARLARLEARSLLPNCCPQTPDGQPIPTIVPRQTPAPLPPGVDDRCRRIAGALAKSIQLYNETLDRLKNANFEETLGVVALIEIFSLQMSFFVPYITQAVAANFLREIFPHPLDALRLTGPFDYCAAARQYVENPNNPPGEILNGASGAARVAYSAWWLMTGGIAWARDMNINDLPVPAGVTASCCLPDQFLLLTSAREFMCAGSPVTTDVVTETDPPDIDVFVAPGVVPRATLAGRYLWSVQNPGRFPIRAFLADAPMLELSCTPVPFVELGAGTNWRVAESGSFYIIMRNIVADEGTYLICTREPYNADANVEDI